MKDKTKERIVVHVTSRTMILALQKWQSYKDYPLDLFHREFVAAQSQLDGKYHQWMDGSLTWMNYTI